MASISRLARLAHLAHLAHLAAPLSVLAFSAASVPALAAVTMQVVIDQRTVESRPQSQALPDSHRALAVTLADDYLLLKSDKDEMVYDFKSRRRYQLDTASRTYVEFSLYDTVGFRVMELKNRINMNAALAKVKFDIRPTRLADNENELSISDNGDTRIEESDTADALVFSSEGRKLAEWSKAGARADASDAAHFARFLRLAYGGHPQVLDKLARGTLIPGRFTLTMDGMGGVRVADMTIADVKTVNAPAYDLHGYTRRLSAADPLDALLDRMAALTPEQLAALRAAHPCDTAADFREDQLADSILGRTECTLASGAAMLPFTPEQLVKLRESAQVQMIFASTSANTPETYAASVKTLVPLREQAPRKAYVLKLFEANNRIRLGQPEESRRLFIEVLQANPVLGGAYKDMGDLLLMRFDMPRAWRSWDIGRRVAPNLPNFGAVNQFEAQLAKQHPEYF